MVSIDDFDLRAGAPGHAEWYRRIDAQRFFQHGVQIRELADSTDIEFLYELEATAHLSRQFFQRLRVLQQMVRRPTQQACRRFRASDDEHTAVALYFLWCHTPLVIIP